MAEECHQGGRVGFRLVRGHDAGVDADEAGARQAVHPADRQDGQCLALFGPALCHHADPVEFAVPLILELAPGNVGRMVCGPRRRGLHPQRVAQHADLLQRVSVTLRKRESEMRDARRRNHGQARPAMQFVIQHRSQVMVTHVLPYE